MTTTGSIHAFCPTNGHWNPKMLHRNPENRNDGVRSSLKLIHVQLLSVLPGYTLVNWQWTPFPLDQYLWNSLFSTGMFTGVNPSGATLIIAFQDSITSDFPCWMWPPLRTLMINSLWTCLEYIAAWDFHHCLLNGIWQETRCCSSIFHRHLRLADLQHRHRGSEETSVKLSFGKSLKAQCQHHWVIRGTTCPRAETYFHNEMESLKKIYENIYSTVILYHQ